MNLTECSMQLEAGGASPPHFAPRLRGAGTTGPALHSLWLQEMYTGGYSSRHTPCSSYQEMVRHGKRHDVRGSIRR